MRLVSIGEICALRNGRAFKPTEWSTSGTPIIRIQNLTDETKPFNYCEFEVDSKFHVEKGSLLFSWSGTPGTSFGAFFWRRERGYLNQHIFRIDLYNPKDLYLEYFRLALNSKLEVIIGQAHGGVGLQHITKEKLNKVKVYLPEYNDQIRIAHLLGKVEGLITQRKQHLQQLNDLLKSVFLKMFGDPVRNDKGWELYPLENLVADDCPLTYGIVQPGEEFFGGVPVVRPVDFTNDYVTLPGLKHIDPKIDSQFKRTKLRGGELLMCVRGSTGVISVAAKELRGANVTRGITPIWFDNRVDSRFMLHQLKTQSIQRKIQEKTYGVALKQINLRDLRLLALISPPADLQIEFAKIVEKIEGIKSRYQQSLTELENLYGALSQKAFKGELDLSRVPLTPLTANLDAPQAAHTVAASVIVKDQQQAIDLPDLARNHRWPCVGNS